tara:strand:+ start:2726 stop:3379 length:654 start_codon:yes stop_codon:yes gene_type:complete
MFLSIIREPIMRKIFGKVEIATLLKKLQGKHLKQRERNYLYRSIKPKLLAARMLSQSEIYSHLKSRNRKDDSIITTNLKLYGYPLLGLESKRTKKLPLEELIILIITKYPQARYIESIPILLLKNKIDGMRLLDLASEHGIKNQIGYLLDIVCMLGSNTSIRTLRDYFAHHKDHQVTFLVQGDEDFLRATSPNRIKKWNLLGRFFDEDFRRLKEIYV